MGKSIVRRIIRLQMANIYGLYIYILMLSLTLSLLVTQFAYGKLIH